MRALIPLRSPVLVSDIPLSVYSRGLAMGRRVLFLLAATLFLPISAALADSAVLSFNGHSYQRFDTVMDWTAAKSFCEGKGAHLATVTTQAENDFVSTNFLPNYVWLGASDAASEGVWTWVTGEPWSYSNWHSGEPNNFGGVENYLSTSYPGDVTWNDAQGNTNVMTPLCEWEPSSYTDNGDGTVTDSRTGLIWMRCSMGQTWESGTCTGLAGTYTKDEAWGLSNTFAGHNDWRLASNEELLGITDTSRSSPAIDVVAFPNTPSYRFWTSTPYIPSAIHAYAVYFTDGSLQVDLFASQQYHARLVRGQTAVTTSCGAPVTGVAFSDHFSGTALDSSKWTTMGEGTGGTVTVTPGTARFDVSGNILFAQTVTNPIPPTGDFSIYCKGKLYSSGSAHGTLCTAMETAWPTYNGYDSGTSWAVFARYGMHGDSLVVSTGGPGPVLFRDDFPAEINTTHEWEICVRGDTVERFKDGVSLGVMPLPAGWHRPTHIAMGNPNSPGPSWTSHETNVIEVRSLQTLPSTGLVGYWNFNNCNATDYSGNGLNGTISGAPACVAGRNGMALKFNGSSDWITVPDSNKFPQSAITIAYWIKRDGLAPTFLQNYVSKELAFQSYLDTTKAFSGGLWKGSPGQWSQYGTGENSLPTLDDWILFTFTYDNASATAKTYLNGNLVSTTVETDPNARVRMSTQPLYIGRNGSQNVYHIQGSLDEVRIYNRVLSDSEITQLAGISPSATFPVTVTGSGTGTGTITSGETPAHINCTRTAGTTSGTCSSNETANATVTLTATPANGSAFTGWSGECTNATGTCTVTMDAAKSVEAGFDLITNAPVGLSLPPPVAPTVTQSEAEGDGYVINGTRLNVSICEGCYWSAESTVPWIELLTTSGTGPGALNFAVKQFSPPDLPPNSRTGYIKVNNTSWLVVQAALHDSDGDGVWDEWENRGVPLDDGSSDRMPLPSADANKKNVWIWIDEMSGLIKDVQLTTTAMHLVKRAFERQGIVATVNINGNKINNSKPRLSPLINDDVAELKNQYFHKYDTKNTEVRSKAWRYVVWGGKYQEQASDGSWFDNGSSGIGRPQAVYVAAEYGRDCLWKYCRGDILDTDIRKAGTLLHELGHAFGLGHGGPWGLDNSGDLNGLTTNYKYKPNHISVMNYAYQLSGLETNRVGSPKNEYKIDFDMRQRQTVDENNLSSYWAHPMQYLDSSNVYVNDGDYGLVQLCHENDTASVDRQSPLENVPGIDYVWDKPEDYDFVKEEFNPGESANCGVIAKPNKADLDANGRYNQIPAASEWDKLNYRHGGLIGALGMASTAAAMTLASEEVQQYKEAPANLIDRPLTYDHAVLINGEATKHAKPGYDVQFAFYVENRGFVADTYQLSASTPSGWAVSGYPASVDVAPGIKKWLSFMVTVPASASIGLIEKIVVTADSAGKLNNSDSKDFEVVVDATLADPPTEVPTEITAASPFAFAPVSLVPRSTNVESQSVVLNGFNVPILLRMRGGSVSVNGGDWTVDPLMVTAGDSLRVRILSSSVAGVSSNAELAVGGVVADFSVTTAPTYAINASASPVVGGVINCSPNPVEHGGSTSCTVTPAEGYNFTAWSGDCTGAACSLSNVTSTKNVTANFAPVTSYTGPLPGGGSASISVAGEGCMLASAQFVAAPAGSPPGTSFPHGLADFSIVGCVGGTATVTVTYPAPIPAGAKFWKAEGGVYAEYPATIGAYSVTFTLTDNGAGDSDPTNGVIHDPSGIGVAAANGNDGEQPIPVFSPWALALLAGLLGLGGVWARRRS